MTHPNVFQQDARVHDAWTIPSGPVVGGYWVLQLVVLTTPLVVVMQLHVEQVLHSSMSTQFPPFFRALISDAVVYMHVIWFSATQILHMRIIMERWHTLFLSVIKKMISLYYETETHRMQDVLFNILHCLNSSYTALSMKPLLQAHVAVAGPCSNRKLGS